MYIEPNTIVRILKNCPLDTTYDHTLYFASTTDQENYFKGLTKYTLTNQTYQRVERGYMRVAIKAEDLYDCNYLMFQNTSFGTKWFYAFIKSVEYVNNITSQIEFEIDVMQTWLRDYTLGECFVEREHSVTDNVGDNLVKEDVYFGQYVYENSKTFSSNGLSLEDLSVVIMYNPAKFDPINLVTGIDNYRYNENLYSGVYQGVRFIAIPATRGNAEIIEPLITSTDFLSHGGFLSAFLMPTMFLPNKTVSLSDGIEYNKMVSLYVNRPTSFDGYTPKNNKLFTYPYTCAYLTSMRGRGNEFPFEYFAEEGKALFYAEGNLCANPSVMAYPFGYKGVSQYLEGAVSIDSYPICTWGADGVTEWINNNLFKSMATAGALVGIGLGVPPATAVGMGGLVSHAPAIAGGVGGVGSTVGAISGALHSAMNTPAGTLMAVGRARSECDPGTVHGGVNGDILVGNINGRHIHAMVERITRQYAEIVDEYFSRFGYATNRVKVPNISFREHWNYVKTGGCTIVGSIPCDDARKICDIYDRGITFWKNGANVGKYSLDNSIKVVT